MKKLFLITLVVLIAALIAACGPPDTLESSWTEAELQQEDVLCNAIGLQIDLQPGKIVCTGVLDGEDVEIELVVDIVDDTSQIRIVGFLVNGKEATTDDIAEANTSVSKDNTFLPDEGYAVTSIIITDNDLTVIQTLK